MRTTYDTHNAQFSDVAHMSARKLIYPAAFGVDPTAITYERELVADSPRGRILDGEMAIDCTLHIHNPAYHAPLIFSVQERFRRAKYRKWRDITITEWNNTSNTPSELYKIRAGLFVYAYYDDNADTFFDVTIAHVSMLIQCIHTGKLPISRQRNAKNQDFIGVKIDDMSAIPGLTIPVRVKTA